MFLNKNKLAKDRRGATTAEFMVILPLIFLWFAASFVFFDVFTVSSTAKRSTYTVADMLSRQTEVTDDFLKRLGTVYQGLAGKNADANDTAIRISAVRNIGGTDTVMWSNASGEWDGTVYYGEETPGPSDALVQAWVPDLSESEEMIMVETRRKYVPAFDWVGVSERDLETVAVVYIRFAPKVANVNQPEPDPTDTFTPDFGSSGGTIAPEEPIETQ